MDENQEPKKRKTKTTKDGTYMSLKLSTALFDKLKFSTEILKMTQTDIVEAALTLFFKEQENLTFLDEYEKNLIVDEESFMVPKELYARLNGITLFEVENFIKQNKIKVVSLNSDREAEKKISYMIFRFDDQKTFLGLILHLQHNCEKLRVDVIKCNQKVAGLENSIHNLRKNKKE